MGSGEQAGALQEPAVVVTGAVRRGGAAIARQVHRRGRGVVIHCRASSRPEAETLVAELCAERPGSARWWEADLERPFSRPDFADQVVGVVANASEFVPSHFADDDARMRLDLDIHLHGHLRLIRFCQPSLIAQGGAIVAVGDIHALRPARGYFGYHVAKGALLAAVRALAVELAPRVRVNAVLPGNFDWPHRNAGFSESQKAHVLQTTPLGRLGMFEELAKAVEFLMFDATFTTGAWLTVDGGRSITLE